MPILRLFMFSELVKGIDLQLLRSKTIRLVRSLNDIVFDIETYNGGGSDGDGQREKN